MSVCRSCGTVLESDEIAIYRRMIDREAAQYDCLCKVCLANSLGVSVSAIENKIAQFKKLGCTLFSCHPLDNEKNI